MNHRFISKLTQALLFGSLLAAIGCGPTVKVNKELAAENPRLLALLPLKTPPSLRAERKAILEQNLKSELRNNNYSLLEDAIVAKVCAGDAACPNRERLFSNYNVQGIVEVGISSASKNNFLAGYVDQVNGELRLLNRSGTTLVEAQHRETESGGLLFNSGQLFQGIKSSVENYGDAGFVLLAKKFSRTLVSQIPAPNAGKPTVAAPVSVTNIDVTPQRPFVYQVCAEGSPQALAYLSLGKARSNLREVRSGRYCGVYRIPEALRQGTVELRSPFGDVARKDASFAATPSCNVRERVELVENAGAPELTLQCTNAGESAKKRLLRECLSLSECNVDRLVVYRAPASFGPYEKVAELDSASWRDTKAKGSDSVYQLIAISRDGARSLPFAPARKGGAASNAIQTQ